MDAADLQATFSPNKALEPDVVSELQSMMRLHGLSAEDLFFKWESYCIKMDLDAQDSVSLSALRNLKQSIQDALEQKQVRAERRPVAATPRAGAGGDVYGILDGLVPNTPRTGERRPAKGGAGDRSGSVKRPPETPRGLGSSRAGAMGEQLKSMSAVPPSSFTDRRNPGEVIEVLNGNLAPADPPLAPAAETRIKLTAASDQKKMAYRPLAMKLSEASEILDDRIDEFTALVQEHHGLEDTAFGSAASQSTTQVVAVGRIASDSAGGKLNPASLVLETSRRIGMGFRVPLNMSKIQSWSFFPGQIVALRGSNTSGRDFVVHEILELPCLGSAASTPATLDAYREKLRGGPGAMDLDSEPGPLSILLAAGPYTADDNLDFEPLHALCSQAADTYADVLVLSGPFVDADHPLIATGDFDLPEAAAYDPDTATMTTVFKYLVAPALQRLVSSNPSIAIILVPSVRDVIDKHVSWPQDAIPRKDLGLPKAAKLVSNPMTLSINEMVLGVSSQDVLYELRSEEVVVGTAKGELMGRLCKYLIDQRHYFPLFPPSDRSRLPKTGTEEGVPSGALLDPSYLKLGEMINVRPDVMLVPSLLPPFAKVVDSVLAINPGTLSKRRGAGTYARMTLHPPNRDAELTNGMVVHRVYDRARVEIVRI